MEFWGVEVKVGQPIQVEPGFENIIHLSQACLAEVKKDNEKDPVHLYVNTDDKKLCIGTLSADKCPQIGFDLVFDKEFQLSHTSKSGNVHFCGYKTNISNSYSEDTGNIATVGHTNKEALEPSRQMNQDDDDSSDSFDSSDDEDTANAKKVSSEEDDSDDEDESDDNDESDDSDEHESDKEAGNKTTPGNKRENDSSVQTSVPEKKAKLVTPQKIVSTDAKKSGGHVATPYPSKQVAKTSGKSDKSNQQSQKTGEFRCNPCSRTFGSENALQSHSKAKH
ncbi:unnamed protein product [Rhodiola kirilowii]